MATTVQRVADWVFPHRGPEAGTVVLSQRRVYILPTGQGWLFAVTIGLLLIGSINYNLSLGYVLTFLLAALGVVAMLHTWRNLAQLALRPGRVEPVFAGEHAVFAVTLENHAGFDRVAIGVTRAESAPAYADVPVQAATSVPLTLLAQRRGRMPLGRFRVFTTYPLGLFRAWSNVELDEYCVVYPRPEPGEPPLPAASPVAGDGGVHGEGSDDFAGLREYHPGDSLRHVAWKAFARGDQLLTKQFGGRTGHRLWLDWALLPPGFSTEEKLSRLARWVIAAQARDEIYGLRIPGRELVPTTGSSHRDACLESLALYEDPRPV